MSLINEESETVSIEENGEAEENEEGEDILAKIISSINVESGKVSIRFVLYYMYLQKSSINFKSTTFILKIETFTYIFTFTFSSLFFHSQIFKNTILISF